MATYDMTLDFNIDDAFDTDRNPRTHDGFLTPPVLAGGGVTYRMRGFDQNVAVDDIVFWDSDHVDADASDYSGSAGPVVDIVVQKKTGN